MNAWEYAILDFALLILATWRLASMLSTEDGPWDIFARLRHAIGLRYDEWSNPIYLNTLAKGIVCFWCVSVWLAFVAAFFSPFTGGIVDFIVNWLAISAVAIFINETVNAISKH